MPSTNPRLYFQRIQNNPYDKSNEIMTKSTPPIESNESLKETTIPRIPISSISPSNLFQDYISLRKPVILTGHEYARTLVTDLKTKLQQHSSDCKVLVESSVNQTSFGSGQESRKEMNLSDLFSAFESGRQDLYMTTQYSLDDSVIAPPMNQVPDLVQLNLELFGNLVPQLVNLWMGNSEKGTTSGLHHDYHDNFYFLVHGKKEFHLYPPHCASKMYLNGPIRRVHENGLIEYDQGDEKRVRGDGAPLGEVAAYRVKKAECILEDPEASVEEKLKAEAELDAALEDMLKYQDDDDDGNEEDEDFLAQEYEDDFHDDDDQQQYEFDHFSDDDEEEDDDEDQDNPNKRPRVSSFSSVHSTSNNTTNKNSTEPPHFSRVKNIHSSSGDTLDTIKQSFPDFPHSEKRSITLNPGEILYLPASWFHEVISCGESSSSPFHMALNYWFFPPTEKSFLKPYVDDFWKEKIESMLNKE